MTEKLARPWATPVDLALILGAVLGTACGKSPSAASEITAPAPSASVAPAASVAAAPRAPATKAPDAPAAHASWRGSYTSVAGTLYIPDDWKSVHWKVPDTQAGLGQGTMTLSVEEPSGRVFGAVEGPLGPATIDGYAADGKLTATLSPKDPSSAGFSGTLAGALADGRAEGTLNASLAEANAIRTATFALTPAAPPSDLR